jgi:serine/threonine-protein kinase
VSTIGGRYVVERRLGHGGMATVELARDEQLGRNVAVKRLSPALADDEVFRERFLREARMAGGLSHPNIVAVYDVGEEDGVPYIVMECVEGETLADLMARTGPMDADRAVDLVLQACAGLEHAHQAGLVHRDVKPQNLLVRPDDTLKIADFGIARPLDATALTLAGTVLGTAAYLAPEQAVGEQVTPAADIYSLGAVTYELLTGRTPYAFDSLAELTVLQRETEPPPMDGVPPELAVAVLSTLRTRPEERPSSALAYAHELAQASPDVPTETVALPAQTEVTQSLAAPRRRPQVSGRVQVALFGALGAVALLGGLAFGMSRGDGTDPPPPAPAPELASVPPRGQTPEESARLLADWLRARAD